LPAAGATRDRGLAARVVAAIGRLADDQRPCADSFIAASTWAMSGR